MKHALTIQDETESSVVTHVDPDADDAEASGLLDSIAQDPDDQPEAEAAVTEAAAAPAKISRSASSPFLLESLYFRSFGERALLELHLDGLLRLRRTDERPGRPRGQAGEAVGQVAAEIRRWRKPEPYKGKGIKYRGEYIFRKEGKKK